MQNVWCHAHSCIGHASLLIKKWCVVSNLFDLKVSYIIILFLLLVRKESSISLEFLLAQGITPLSKDHTHDIVHVLCCYITLL